MEISISLSLPSLSLSFSAYTLPPPLPPSRRFTSTILTAVSSASAVPHTCVSLASTLISPPPPPSVPKLHHYSTHGGNICLRSSSDLCFSCLNSDHPPYRSSTITQLTAATSASGVPQTCVSLASTLTPPPPLPELHYYSTHGGNICLSSSSDLCFSCLNSDPPTPPSRSFTTTQLTAATSASAVPQTCVSLASTLISPPPSVPKLHHYSTHGGNICLSSSSDLCFSCLNSSTFSSTIFSRFELYFSRRCRRLSTRLPVLLYFLTQKLIIACEGVFVFSHERYPKQGRRRITLRGEKRGRLRL